MKRASDAREFKVQIGLRWWFRPCFEALILIARIRRRMPDERTVYLLLYHSICVKLTPIFSDPEKARSV